MFTENTHKMMTRSKSAELLAFAEAKAAAMEHLEAEMAYTAAKKPIQDPSYNMLVAFILTITLVLGTLIVTRNCGTALLMEIYCVFNIAYNYKYLKTYNGVRMTHLEPNYWIRLYKILHTNYNHLAIPGEDLGSEGADLGDDEGLEDLESEGADFDEGLGEDFDEDLESEGADFDEHLESEGADFDEDLYDEGLEDLESEGADFDEDLDDEGIEDLDEDDDDSDYDPEEDDDLDSDEDLEEDLESKGLVLDNGFNCITCDATLITKPSAIFVRLCGDHYCSACFPTVYENMNKTYINEYYTTNNPTGNDGWYDSSSAVFHIGFWLDYQFNPDMSDDRNIEYYKQFSNTVDAIPLAIRMSPDPLDDDDLDDDDLNDDEDEDLNDDEDEDLDDDEDEDLDEDDLDDDEDDVADDADANDWEHCSQ